MENPASAPVFNTADYPRRYVYATSKLAWWIGFVVVIACVFAGTVGFLYGLSQEPRNNDVIFFSIVGIATGFIVAVGMLHKSEIGLTAHAITVTKNFRQHSLQRHDIAGWCDSRFWWADIDVIKLVPLRSSLKPLLLSKDDFGNLECDAVFHNWYKSFPDLGAQRKEEYYNAVAHTETLGKTRDERIKNMALAVQALNGFRYFFITAFVLLYLLPNAYLPPLTDNMVIILAILTLGGIITIYRYPILLTEPPVGVGKKKYFPFLIVSGWGFLLLLWLVRDSLLNRNVPDIFNMSLNLYIGAMFLALFLPLLADRNWKQMPKRVLWDAPLILLAACAFYFYGNMALDRTEPLITASYYEERASENPASTVVPYLFATDDADEGKMIDGCDFKYPGAFGTPWMRFSSCPENFQKPVKTK